MANNIKKDAFASYFNLLVTILTGFILVPIIEKSIGKTNFGIYQFVFSLTAYSEIMSMALVKTVERYVAKYAIEENKEKENAVVSVVLSIYMVTMTIFVIGAIIVYINFENFFTFRGDELRIAKTCFFIAAINASLSIPATTFQSYLRGRGRYTFIFNIGTVQAISKLILVYLSLRFGFDIVSLFIIDMLAFQTVNIIYFITVTKEYKVNIRLFKRDRETLTEIFGFTIFLFLAAVGDAFFWNTDNIILGIYSDANNIAEYALSQRLISYFYRYGIAFSGLFLPRFMEHYSIKDKEESDRKIIQLFTESSRTQCILVSFAVVNFLILGNDFIWLWVGSKYNATFLYTVVILVPFWMVLSISTGIEILYVMGKLKFFTTAYFISATLNVISTIILVQSIGPMGAAIATAVSRFIGLFLVVSIYFKYLLNMDILNYFKTVFGKSMLVSLLVLVYGLALNYFIQSKGIIIFVCKGVLVNIVFLPLIFFILLDDEQKGKIIGKVRKWRFFN